MLSLQIIFALAWEPSPPQLPLGKALSPLRHFRSPDGPASLKNYDLNCLAYSDPGEQAYKDRLSVSQRCQS